MKAEGGILEQLIREVEIECLPADIPKAIYADVTNLKHGDNLRVSDLAHGDKWKFITEEDQMVAHVTHVKEEVVATPEAVAAEAGTTPAEPEVIKKGKQETEGAAEGGEAPEGRREEGEEVASSFLREQQIATSGDALLAMTTRGGMAEDRAWWLAAGAKAGPHVASLLWMTRESDGERGGVAGWPRQRGEEA